MKVGKYLNLPVLLFAVLFVALIPAISSGLGAPISQAQAALSEVDLDKKADEACADKSSTAAPRAGGTDKGSCKTGYKGGYNGKSETEACSTIAAAFKDTCGEGYDKGKTFKASETGAGNPTSDPQNTPVGEEADTGCGTDFDWIFCKIIRGTADVVRWVEETMIEPFLDVQPLSFSQSATYDIWKVMRDLANGLFVIVFLVFIFAQTLSINLDAYAIKKMIPKLVAAAILVQLSYLLASFAIDIFNVLGRGLFLLTDAAIPVYSPADATIDGSGSGNRGGSFLGLAALAAGAGAILYGAITLAALPVFLAAFFGVIAVFFTLIFRQILIVMLIITAPLALVAWVLPNTEDVFKKWLDLFIKALMMYPIIVLLFAAGRLFSVSAGSTGATLAPIFALVAAVVPLFLVPYAFAFAGGLSARGAAYMTRVAGRGAKGIGNSQNIKDMRENSKEQAFLKYKADGVSRFGRARARMVTGNINPRSAAGNRRLEQGYEKAEKARIEAHTAQFDRDTDPNMGDKLVELAKGNKVAGYENSETMQMAAIRRLAKTGQVGKLREVQQHLSPAATSNPSVANMYNRAIQPEMKDLGKAAPDLLKATSGDFSKMPLLTAEGIGNLDTSTVESFLDNNTSVSASDKQLFMEQILKAYNTPAQRAKMSPKLLRSLHDAAGRGGLGGVTMSNGSNAGIWLRRNIDPNTGQWT